jgi:hypothetical protein
MGIVSFGHASVAAVSLMPVHCARLIRLADLATADQGIGGGWGGVGFREVFTVQTSATINRTVLFIA